MASRKNRARVASFAKPSDATSLFSIGDRNFLADFAIRRRKEALFETAGDFPATIVVKCQGIR